MLTLRDINAATNSRDGDIFGAVCWNGGEVIRGRGCRWGLDVSRNRRSTDGGAVGVLGETG